MDTTQVVQALVDPQNGVIVRMVDKIGGLEKNTGEIGEVLKVHGVAIQQNTSRIDGLGNEYAHLLGVLDEVNGKIEALNAKIEDLFKICDQFNEQIDILRNAPKPTKRNRSKKAEPEPAPVEETPVEQVDPTAPAYEPGLVPDEIEGMPVTGKVVQSIRNNIKVLSLDMAKNLDTTYSPAMYDFVAGLTDEEANAIVEKFPG